MICDDTLSECLDGESVKLDISIDQARRNLNAAGKLVDEDEDGIKLSDNSCLMNDKVNEILDKITADIDLPYEISYFQRLSINALGY